MSLKTYTWSFGEDKSKLTSPTRESIVARVYCLHLFFKFAAVLYGQLLRLAALLHREKKNYFNPLLPMIATF